MNNILPLKITLPEKHVWEEIDVDTGVGVDYMWVCEDCGSVFYVNIDQGEITSSFSEGEGNNCFYFK